MVGHVGDLRLALLARHGAEPQRIERFGHAADFVHAFARRDRDVEVEPREPSDHLGEGQHRGHDPALQQRQHADHGDQGQRQDHAGDDHVDGGHLPAVRHACLCRGQGLIADLQQHGGCAYHKSAEIHGGDRVNRVAPGGRNHIVAGFIVGIECVMGRGDRRGESRHIGKPACKGGDRCPVGLKDAIVSGLCLQFHGGKTGAGIDRRHQRDGPQPHVGADHPDVAGQCDQFHGRPVVQGGCEVAQVQREAGGVEHRIHTGHEPDEHIRIAPAFWLLQRRVRDDPPGGQIGGGFSGDLHLTRGTAIAPFRDESFELRQGAVHVLAQGRQAGARRRIGWRVPEQGVTGARSLVANPVGGDEQQGVDVHRALDPAGELVLHHHLREHPAAETGGQRRHSRHANDEQGADRHERFRSPGSQSVRVRRRMIREQAASPDMLPADSLRLG